MKYKLSKEESLILRLFVEREVPVSLEDTAFDAVSSKFSGNPRGTPRLRAKTLHWQSRHGRGIPFLGFTFTPACTF